MKVTVWGSRGSVAAPGSDTARFGGNTSCVQVEGADGTILVLDAGTGVRRLAVALPRPLARLDVLLTHLHLDHIQGLGFFDSLHDPELEVHLWGPAASSDDLRARLMRYLSPPLFPVRLRDLSCRLFLHEVPRGDFHLGELAVRADLVCHPGATVGYRIATDTAAFAYLPDHEPALGVPSFPAEPEWTSGYALAAGVDLLFHDAQYTAPEYAERVGWGHSSVDHAVAFAGQAGVRRLVLFHHDPSHDDDAIEVMVEGARSSAGGFPVEAAREGAVFEVS